MRARLSLSIFIAACVPDTWALRAQRDAAPVVDAPRDAADDDTACAGIQCNGRCVDPLTDRLHCGGCERPCSGTCAGGVCACPTATARCGDVCAYLSYSDAHCGVCGNACPRGERCLGGACTGAGLRVMQLSVAREATWALMSDGSLRAAGRGVGAYEGVPEGHRNVFVSVPGMTGLVEASGPCGRRADGSVWCKFDGRAPQRVQGLDDAVEVSNVCARRADGTVACWEGAAGVAPVATRVAALDGVTQVSSSGPGEGHCGLRGDGTVWCWGDVGAWLDTGAPPRSRVTATPERMPGIDDAVSISAGHHMLCAVIRGGTVRCVGRRTAIVGLVTVGNVNVPATVIEGATGVRAVVSGWGGGWALRDDGTVLAWGVNTSGELGDGTFVSRSRAAPVPGLAGVRSLSAGSSASHACAVLDDGSARCWGFDNYGQLGIFGGLGLAPGPVVSAADSASPLQGAFEDDAGGAIHCTRHADGVRCWGDAQYGLLGNGESFTTPVYRPSPGLVPGLTGVASLRSFASGGGGATMCVLLRDGTARCWGSNQRGQVGDGSFTTTRTIPRLVSGVEGATAIGGGDQHTCVIVAGGRVRCWGRGEHGALGNGVSEHAPQAEEVVGLTDVAEVGGAAFTSVARLRDGTVRAWGLLDILLPAVNESNLPVEVPGVTDARQLSMAASSLSYMQLCALRANGRVSCLGSGGATPGAWFDVGLSDVTQISGGARVTCARMADSTVHCWGSNERGGLGNPSLPHTTAYVARPVPVLRLDGSLFVGAVSVRVGGGGYACARMGDDTLQCWGAVTAGLTGTGEAETVPRPRRPFGL